MRGLFDVSARDIGELSDSRLREVTVRVCALELLAVGLPSAAVTAGAISGRPMGALMCR